MGACSLAVCLPEGTGVTPFEREALCPDTPLDALLAAFAVDDPLAERLNMPNPIAEQDPAIREDAVVPSIGRPSLRGKRTSHC